MFAVDSIPAVFAVTRDPFLVYTSNMFALLGLRSLYFLLAGVIRKLRFLRVGLAVMLLMAAAKLAVGDLYHVPPLASLAAIVVDPDRLDRRLAAFSGRRNQRRKPAPTATRSRTWRREARAARNACSWASAG